jgi:hypothetical protein
MKNRFIGLAALYMAIPAILLAQPDEKARVVGVWEVKVAQGGVPQAPLLGLVFFCENGSCTTILGNAIYKPPPALQGMVEAVGTGYGRWVQTGNREFRATVYSALLKAGAANGFERNQSTMVLSESGNECTAHTQADFLDANGTVVLSAAGELKGKRLETPAPVAHSAGQSPFAGTWRLTMWQTGQHLPPLFGLATFSREGSFTTTFGNPVKTETNPVLRAVADTIGAGYGRWVQTGDKELHMTFYLPLLKAGAMNGFSRVQATATLSESGDEFTSESRSDFFDAEWNVLLTAASEVKGTRLETPEQP